MAIAGSVGKASRKEAKGREPANADSRPVLVFQWIRVSLTLSHCRRVVDLNWSEKHEEGVHDSPPVSAMSDKARPSDLSSSQSPFSGDCSPFLNWDGEKIESEYKKAAVYRSLVATLKIQPALDVSLEAKAEKFLESLWSMDEEQVDTLLSCLGVSKYGSGFDLAKSIVVLLSSASKKITDWTVRIIKYLVNKSYLEKRYMLVTADLIPKLINTLNPRSCIFAEAVGIHSCLMHLITSSLHLTTPGGVLYLESEAGAEKQTIQREVLWQVVKPSEQYIRYLCMNRYSIVNGELLSLYFMELLAKMLRICPYHQPTMDFVLHLPVVLTIPSCLTYFEDDDSILAFMHGMVDSQWKWKEEGRKVRQIGKNVHRMLRMEGIEDAIEEKLRNHKNDLSGRGIVFYSIRWNEMLGMNL
ncbi:hypothetical protein BLNAU_7432 [Blattamonas nauphoetae]|uniref:Uncharacterized protein n=1 Tax=Blattamonas nauphoetae TaxID=2049346 RepID=A0ABQ9Y1E3_9EUKA|nr:hypothetical protein BLNAU_7432 [Blattamonas nauphoetae]